MKKKKWFKGLRKNKTWTRRGKSNWYYRFYKIGSQKATFHRRQYSIDKVTRLNKFIKIGRRTKRTPLDFQKQVFGEWLFGLKKPKKDLWISIYHGLENPMTKKVEFVFVHKELLKKDDFYIQLRKIFNENYEEYKMGEMFFTLNKYA